MLNIDKDHLKLLLENAYRKGFCDCHDNVLPQFDGSIATIARASYNYSQGVLESIFSKKELQEELKKEYYYFYIDDLGRGLLFTKNINDLANSVNLYGNILIFNDKDTAKGELKYHIDKRIEQIGDGIFNYENEIQKLDELLNELNEE